jgi:hypothetical protein
MGTGRPNVPLMISSSGTQHKYSLDTIAVSNVTKVQRSVWKRQLAYLRKANVTLWPPNPKELESATVTGITRD